MRRFTFLHENVILVVEVAVGRASRRLTVLVLARRKTVHTRAIKTTLSFY